MLSIKKSINSVKHSNKKSVLQLMINGFSTRMDFEKDLESSRKIRIKLVNMMSPKEYYQ
jgi:hypothetical protein